MVLALAAFPTMPEVFSTIEAGLGEMSTATSFATLPVFARTGWPKRTRLVSEGAVYNLSTAAAQSLSTPLLS